MADRGRARRSISAESRSGRFIVLLTGGPPVHYECGASREPLVAIETTELDEEQASREMSTSLPHVAHCESQIRTGETPGFRPERAPRRLDEDDRFQGEGGHSWRRALRGWAVPYVVPVASADRVFEAAGGIKNESVQVQFSMLGREVVRVAELFAKDRSVHREHECAQAAQAVAAVG